MKNKELDNLRVKDVYSLILFAMYQLKDSPEYSTLSELTFIIKDRDNLLEFFEYFGGQTITIPTLKDLKLMINALLLYQYINIEGMPSAKAIRKLDLSEFKMQYVNDAYITICEVLSKYDFKRF